ncbi:hypothetical protein SCHPADRAFT_997514 [Schizopora paradoxa]|uniref:F-box domain-containing protein n=1 Tax=Schizopora paradoxa TaxID=27342 RepID=A0A0H2RN36_9AGAM|nr:hypothetical protein SCHPADRAFT_997514 [Schizopora paradoxa]
MSHYQMQRSRAQQGHQRRPVNYAPRSCNGAIAVPDVLQRIFLFMVDPPTEEEKQFITERPLTKVTTPWSLLRVCKLWNSIAMASPALWSTIAMVHKRARYTEIARAIPLVEAHLRLSRNMPLTLFFCIRIGSFIPVQGVHQDRRDPARPLYALLKMLMAHQPRWQDVVLSIQASGNAPIGEVYRPLPINITLRFGDMTMLKRLSFRYHSRSEYRGAQDLRLGPCSQLEDLELVGKPSKLSYGQGVSNLFPRLKTMVCRPDDLDAYLDYWNLLTCSTGIENLRFVYYRSDGSDVEAPLPRIVFPRLKSLALQMSLRDAFEVFHLQEKYRSFPALTKLEIEHVFIRDDYLQQLSTPLSFFSLTHLKVDFRPSERQVDMYLYLQFFQSMGGVRHLVLVDYGRDGRSALVPGMTSVFNHIKYHPNPLLQQLSYLDLRLCYTQFKGEGLSEVKGLVSLLCSAYRDRFYLAISSERYGCEAEKLCDVLRKYASRTFRIKIYDREL